MTTTGHVYMQLVCIRNNKIAATRPHKSWRCMNSCHAGWTPLRGVLVYAADARKEYAALLWHCHEQQRPIFDIA